MQLGALEYLISINNKGLNKGISDSEKQVKGLGDRFGSTMTKAGRQLTNFGDKISAWAVAKGKLIASAIEGITTKTADAVKQVIGGAINAYADFEQLVGGVETLFGTRGAKDANEYGKMVGLSGKEAEKAFSRVTAAQEMVLANSKKAYETAGISANRYMENATSFAASLVSSLHDDTYKAAELTDVAIRDMADNANKMGSSMESIENAYAGFAKQNYTMLDNLKLGYGGTKEEMERLLKDAGALAGKKFDAGNFADIVEAIHIIQENKGITGTTAKEAASTISGSINMLKASWQNLLATMGDPNGDMEAVSEQFFNSFETVFKNIAPVFKRVLKNLVKLVRKALPEILKFIRTDLVPEVLKIVRTLIDNLKSSDNPFAQFIGYLADGLSLFLDENGNFRVPSIKELWKKMEPGLTSLWKGIQKLANNVLVLIFGEGPDGGIDFPDNADEWAEKVKTGLSKLWNIVRSAIGTVLRLIFGEDETGGIDWPDAEGWKAILKKGLDAAWGLVKGALESLLVLVFGQNENGGIDWPETAADWLNLIKNGLVKAWDLVKGSLSALLTLVFGEAPGGGIDWPKPKELWEKVKAGFGEFWEKFKVFLRDAAIWTLGEIDLSSLADPQKVWDGIKDTFSKYWDKIIPFIVSGAAWPIGMIIFGAAETLWNSVKDKFKVFWGGVKAKIYEAATWLIGGMTLPSAQQVIEDIEDWWNTNIKPFLKLYIQTPIVEGLGSLGKWAGRTFSGWEEGGSEETTLGWLMDMAFGNAKGNNYVPYDNYPALLHRGEAVLTASQARRYRDGEDGVDMSALIPAVVAAIREGMNGAQVNSFMDSTRVTKETNGVTGKKLAAGRFSMA